MTRSQRFLAAGLLGLLSTTAASAADLYVDIPVAAPVVVDTESRWEGPYIGVFGGYMAGTFELQNEAVIDEFSATGWLLGVNLGADYALDNGIILGVVGDLAFADVSATTGNGSVEIDWVGSLRGRIGIDGGAFLPYLTGGLAVAHMNEINGGASYSGTLYGWTVGGGVEVAVTDALSVDLQYRYSDYGTVELDGGDDSFRSHQATIGLNWAF